MKYLLLSLTLIIASTSCHRKGFDHAEQAKKDTAAIEAWLKENELEAQVTESGLYYIIHELGEGEHPNITSLVRVHYKGSFIDGKVFDQTTDSPATFPLADLIPAWQEGIPLLKEGGQLTLVVPSRLGYGHQDVGPIPANSVLIFEITLVEVR